MGQINEARREHKLKIWNKASDLDKDYFPEVVQVIPTEDYLVYIYFDDGRIKLFDAKELIKNGVFKVLQDKELFTTRCTVLNHTLAWDINGNYSEEDCLDLDPIQLYDTCPEVDEPVWLFKCF
ncbi:MAG TPA: DUF2442 domain-containing protein [Peptococcaceae bacterium]|nr:DUF2442 domain-containing protein [Peptococcaceae bacterium]